MNKPKAKRANVAAVVRETPPRAGARSSAGRFLSVRDKAVSMDIANDPKKAEAFLKEAGLIIRAGKLAPEYAA